MIGYYYLTKASFERAIKEMIRYKFDFLSMIASLYMIFLAMFFGYSGIGQAVGGNQMALDSTLEGIVAGYFMWTIMIMAFFEISQSVISDAGKGTLEQLSMSSLGLHRVLVIRSLINLLISISICVVILILTMATSGYWLEIKVLQSIVVIGIGLFSMLGVSMIFAGIALIHKKVQSFLNIMQFLLLAIVIPGNSAFGKGVSTLIPFRPSIEKFYSLSLGGQNLWDFPISDYLLLIVNAAGYFIIGSLVFKYCTIKAKKAGLLGQY